MSTLIFAKFAKNNINSQMLQNTREYSQMLVFDFCSNSEEF